MRSKVIACTILCGVILASCGNTLQEKEAETFEFAKPVKVDKVEVVKPTERNQRVSFYLGGKAHYDVTLPGGCLVVTDYGKYAYADNNAFSVSIVSNTNKDGFSKEVGIKNCEQVSPTLITRKGDKSGINEAAKYLKGGKAVVVRCYNNQEAFNIILDSLKENEVIEEKSVRLQIKKTTELLTSLPEGGSSEVRVNGGALLDTEKNENIHEMYAFTDGSLSMTRELRGFEECISNVETKAALNTSGVASSVYKGDSSYYAECGGYAIGVLKVNYNTSITLVGSGQEARDNIAGYLKANNT